MNSVTVDELVMRIEIELDRFRSQAVEAERLERKLRSSMKGTEQASKSAGAQVDKTSGAIERSNQQLTSGLKAVSNLTTGFVRFFGLLAGSTAVQKLGNHVAQLNDELNFLSQRLNMSASQIRGMDAAVAALGGSGSSAQATMRQLNQGIQEMVLMGNDALIPFFSALGVGVVDASGDIRAMDEILLDMADSLSQMKPEQAYAFAQAMGLDEGTTNALLQGRDALQDMLDTHKSLYVSTEEELAASRELNKVQAVLSARWLGLKTILGNAVIPMLTKMAETVSGWLDYLNRNERTVKNVFEGMAIAIGVILLPILAKAALGMFALLSPVLLTGAAVAALAAGFALLYEDYKVWAAGGKSLFDWGAFIGYFKDAEFSVDNLKKAFVRLLTGYNSWDEARKGFTEWLKDKGLITEYGLSMRGLAESFQNLAKHIWNSIPPLKTLVEMAMAIMDGRWGDAAALAGRFGVEVVELGVDSIGGFTQHVAGAIDTALGHDPNSSGTLSSAVSGIRETVKGWLGFGSESHEERLARHERRVGFPAGTLRAVQMQETGGSQAYLDDPSKYHYELNAEGKRIAPHTGKVSTAFGPYGILESTARDPGYGVTPLRDKSLEEQTRFMADYLAARVARAGSLRGGLAGYGEGESYADSVLGRAGLYAPALQGGSNTSNTVSVSVGQVTVQTTAQTLPAATAAGVAAGIQQSEDLLNQLGGGM